MSSQFCEAKTHSVTFSGKAIRVRTEFTTWTALLLQEAFKQYSGFVSEIWEAVMLVLLMGRIYARWHDVHTKFHYDRFRHLSNITVITATIWEAVMLVSLIEGIYEVCHWDGFMWNQDLCRRSSNIKVLPQKFERLYCWYYWWEGFFSYAVEIDSCAVIYLPSFIKIGSGVQKLIGRDTQTHTHTDSKVIS
jgi:hypothetical protein